MPPFVPLFATLKNKLATGVDAAQRRQALSTRRLHERKVKRRHIQGHIVACNIII